MRNGLRLFSGMFRLNNLLAFVKHLPIIFTLIGFILLLTFEGLWLASEYRDAKDQLQLTTNSLIVEEVRGLEDSLIQEMLVNMSRMPSVPGNRLDTTRFEIKSITVQKDAVNSLINKDDSSITFSRKVPEFRFFSSGSDSSQDLSKSGSMSIFIDIRDSLSQHASKSDSSIRVVLHKRFERIAAQAPLPLEYKVLNRSADSLGSEFLIYRYHDIPSGEEISLVLADPRSLILKSIWPQIAFAFLLLLSLSLAFWMTFRSLHKQRQLAKLKQDFVNNMTHELKTPITTVGVAIEALRNFQVLEDPQRTAEYLDISHHELNRLGLLVDRVLRMAQFERGAPELKLESLNFRALIEDVLRAMKLQFEQVKAEVNVHFQGDSFQLKGDRGHLASVLYNLLDNALKYSPTPPKVAVSLEADTHGLSLQIRDQGIGIPAKFLPHVFDPFFRVPQGNRHDIKGHGLGLSYVAAVVRQHQGHITVDSQPDAGATFSIYLPQANEQNENPIR